jgi:anti-anti-sigma factor
MDFQTPPVAVAPIGDGFRLTLSGPIHTNTAWIEREFDKVIARKPKLVELDLSCSEHISSVGLGVLVSLHNRLKQAGGAMTIVKILPRTKGILRAAYLDRMFTIAPDAVVGANGK